ncbi:septal ring lytic transglycosylase RlpA family protein [Luteimonas aestuarii]|uniref:Endolytic peptidoglycan transglycosylase RlpA n=1 Tax=Luteimonas aestuarii TaxID=453837 RepID=A0A4R5TTS8_9GAMM|nr:septal ring lytic transglycosylase RlpA family protein [Luteimonas aestuarii]TDK24426.1 septal ring lytic transglycosylase RlpA family protein [Luteimonas aestuarii]
MKAAWPALAVLLLAACSGAPKKPDAPAARVAGGASGPITTHVPAPVPAGCIPGVSPYPAMQEDLSTRGDYVAGGLYKPGVSDTVPDYLPRVECIPEPVVAHEPLSRVGNRTPYTVLGRSYQVRDSADGFVETGIASYYGNKFHGRRTSNQEVYDMYAFTAAHKSLPLPSFARVTNLDNGRSVVVRVNDRGPFHEGRVIDLSYAAAVKLDIHRQGTGRVEVRGLTPGQAQPTLQAAAPSSSGLDGLVQALPAPPPVAVTPLAAAPAAATPASVATPVAPVAATSPPAASTRAADHPGYGREENRFTLLQDGRVRTADEFDAWMRERQARIDAQAAAAPVATPTAMPVASGSPPSTPPAASVTPVAAATPALSAGGLTLQVGVFSQRDNAQRVLSTLHGAGIASASVQDAARDGRALWRVRVGGVEPAGVSQLSARIAALGLGTPQIVRE